MCISHCLAQDEPLNVSVCARHSFFMSSMMCAWAFVVCLFVFVFLLFLSVVYFFSSFPNLLHHGDVPSSHRLWVPCPWRLPLLRDFCNDLPGGIRRQRYGALVLVWRGTRQWNHRESALFTTVHSGTRRTSGPKTSLSLSWRKFVVSSVLRRTRKNGETRTRT